MPLTHEPTCPCIRCSKQRKETRPGPRWPTAPLDRDGPSTKPAPGPIGPSGAEAVALARKERAERRAEEAEQEKRR